MNRTWLLPDDLRFFEETVRADAERINVDLDRLEADFAWKRDYYDQHGECHSEQFRRIIERFDVQRTDLMRLKERILKPLVDMLMRHPRPMVIELPGSKENQPS